MQLLRRHFSGFYAVIISAFILVTSCSDVNLYSPEQSVELGNRMSEQIAQDDRQFPELNNPRARQYLQNICNRIVQAPQIKYKNLFKWKVTIIDNDKTVNAFAIPGGYIYFYTGMLKMLDAEATVAAIMAHEIAHAEERHATEQMTKAYGQQILLGIALGEDPGRLESMLANLFNGLALLKHSRDDEMEADEMSFKYLNSINVWYPGAMKQFFEKMEKGKSGPQVMEIFSTHPQDENRVEKINEMLRDNNVGPPTDQNMKYREYAKFKQMLR